MYLLLSILRIACKNCQIERMLGLIFHVCLQVNKLIRYQKQNDIRPYIIKIDSFCFELNQNKALYLSLSYHCADSFQFITLHYIQHIQSESVIYILLQLQMFRLSNNDVAIQNCLLQIYVSTMQISFKFPCVYLFQCKTIDNKLLAASIKRPKMQNMFVQFEQAIKFQTNMIYNKKTKAYLKKQIFLIINLISDSRQDQVKLVGKTAINLSNLMQKNQADTLRKGKSDQKIFKKKETSSCEIQNEQQKKLDLCSCKGSIKFTSKLIKVEDSDLNLADISKSQFNQNFVIQVEQHRKMPQFQKLQIDKFPSQFVLQPVKKVIKSTLNIPINNFQKVQYESANKINIKSKIKQNNTLQSTLKLKQLEEQVQKLKNQQLQMIKMMEILQQKNRDLQEELSQKELYLKQNLQKLQQFDHLKYQLMELRQEVLHYENQKYDTQKQDFNVFQSRFRQSQNYRDSIKEEESRQSKISRQSDLKNTPISLRDSEVHLTSSELRLCDGSTVRMQKQLSFMDIQLEQIRMQLQLIKDKYENEVRMHMQTKQQWFKTQQSLQQIQKQYEDSVKAIQQLENQVLQKKSEFIQEVKIEKIKANELKQIQRQLKCTVQNLTKQLKELKIIRQIQKQSQLQELILRYEETYRAHKDSIAKCKKLEKQNYHFLEKQKENQYNYGVKLWELQNQIFFLNQKLQNSARTLKTYVDDTHALNQKIKQLHTQVLDQSQQILNIKKQKQQKSAQLQSYIQKQNVMKQYLNNLEQQMSQIYKIVNQKQRSEELLNNQLLEKEKQLQKNREELLYYQNYIQGLQAKCITSQKQMKLLINRKSQIETKKQIYKKDQVYKNDQVNKKDQVYKKVQVYSKNEVSNKRPSVQKNILSSGSDWNNSIESIDLQKKLTQSYEAQQQLIKKNKSLIQLINLNTQKVIYSQKNKKQIVRLSKQLQKDKQLRTILQQKNNHIKKLNQIIQKLKQQKNTIKQQLTIAKIQKGTAPHKHNHNQPKVHEGQAQCQLKTINFTLTQNIQQLEQQLKNLKQKFKLLEIDMSQKCKQIQNMEEINKQLSVSLKHYQSSFIQTQQSLITKETELQKLETKLKLFQFSELSKRSSKNQRVIDSRSYSAAQGTNKDNKDKQNAQQLNQNIRNLKIMIQETKTSKIGFHQNFNILMQNSQELYELSQVKLLQKQIILQKCQGLSMQFQKLKSKLLKSYKAFSQKANLLQMFKPLEQNVKCLLTITQSIQETKLTSRSQCIQ